jgi:hypothetical protein
MHIRKAKSSKEGVGAMLKLKAPNAAARDRVLRTLRSNTSMDLYQMEQVSLS